jgi:hypothetical protein
MLQYYEVCSVIKQTDLLGGRYINGTTTGLHPSVGNGVRVAHLD